jgi:Velvet factor
VLCDVWTADASSKVNLVIHPSEAPMLTPGNSSAAAAAMSSAAAASLSHSPPTIAVAGTKLNPDSTPSGTNNDSPSPAATRNLIGSLVSSAAKLFDTEDQLGIYFVFQDLSIRTEGTFRLGFSLVDVGS